MLGWMQERRTDAICWVFRYSHSNTRLSWAWPLDLPQHIRCPDSEEGNCLRVGEASDGGLDAGFLHRKPDVACVCSHASSGIADSVARKKQREREWYNCSGTNRSMRFMQLKLRTIFSSRANRRPTCSSGCNCCVQHALAICTGCWI
jgi:hypothetical protein